MYLFARAWAHGARGGDHEAFVYSHHRLTPKKWPRYALAKMHTYSVLRSGKNAHGLAKIRVQKCHRILFFGGEIMEEAKGTFTFKRR
jgi:hypothetical protein